MPALHYVIYFFAALACIALVAAFIIMLIEKVGIRDYIIMSAPKLISKLFSCDFCLSFWTALILASVLACICGEAFILFIPIVTTPLTRLLI